LILVLTFVGFVAAHQGGTGLEAMLAGLLGSALVTFVTFAPCFLWIFLGAPYVERLRGRPVLAGALATITAAVVGVILNLALWFGLHVLFADLAEARLGPLRLLLPEPASLDAAALLLTALATLLLLRTRAGMIPTLAVCGAAGAAWRLFLA
jgi:chromate transporter